MLTDTEQRVLAAIDQDQLIATLQELIAQPSLGGSDAEYAVQEVAAAHMRAQGLPVTMSELDLAALYAHPAFPGYEVERRAARHVQATLAGTGNGRSLIFNGHLDVVPVGDASAWRADPWSGVVAAGRVYGRGSCDMKGGVACIIHAAGAIARSGVQLHGSLAVQTVIGEEDGGLGAFAAALHGPRADGAMIAEPTRLQPVLAQAGALTFRLRVTGRAAHGAQRTEGVSAIDAYLPLHHALHALEQERNRAVAHPLMRPLTMPYPISVGLLQAGDWASTVPETLVAEGRYGVMVGENVGTARAVLEGAIARAAANDDWLRDHPPALEWWGGQFESAELAGDHPLVQTLDRSMADLGRAVTPEGVAYGSDMRLLQHVGGTPTLLFGPGDVRIAHQRDEYIPIADLVAATRAFALTALRFCGYSA